MSGSSKEYTMTPLSRVAVAMGAWSLMASCIPDMTGAPCLTTDTCPPGQYCTAARFCAPGVGLAGSDGGPGAATGGGSGAATGGGSGTAQIGAGCISDYDCASRWCYIHNPGGECTSLCETDDDCGSAAICDDYDDEGVGSCYLKCGSDDGCRSGYECFWGICLPQH